MTVTLFVLFSSLLYAEEEFPPGPRLRENSSWWTSQQKKCDSVWIEFKTAVDALVLADETKTIVHTAVTDAIANRTSESLKLGAVAAEYWVAKRGKDIHKCFKDYGSTTKLSDSVLMQDALDFYCDIAKLLANDTVEGIEELVAGRGMSAVNLTLLKTKYEPDILKRYYEITGDFGERVFSIVRIGPDLSAVRKVFAELSESAIALANEFYLAIPSSVDLFVFADSKGNKWLQFNETPRNPYFGKEGAKDGTLTPADCDDELLKNLLESLRVLEASYKTLTITSINDILNVLPQESKEKLTSYADKLKD